MFDADYDLLKAQALAGYDRNARKASDVSEKTRMIQTACDSRLTLRLKKKINGAEEEIQESEDSETHPQGETNEE